MEPIKTYIAQNYAKLKDLYLSMTLGNRIVAALLAATLFISLGYLIVGSIKPADFGSKTVYIYNGYRFDQFQQRAADSSLAKKNLREHQWVGDRLQVPRDKLHLYVAALAEDDVVAPTSTPRQDTADNFSPFHHAKIMDTRMIAASERSTAAAIKMLPGIADAWVMSYKRPEWERNVWARKNVISVSVTLDAIEKKPLPDETIAAVGRIVAPAFGITNLKEIAIVDARNTRSYNGAAEELGSAQGEYLRHVAKAEERFKDTIYKQLSHIDGIEVHAAVTLTTHRELRTFEVEHDRPTPLTIHEMDYHFMREGHNRFFRPGHVAQWGVPLIDPTGNVGPTDKTDEKKREFETTHALPGREINSETLPYIPQLVTVSIRIPNDYVLSMWREDNMRFGGDPDAIPTPEELRAKADEIEMSNKRLVSQLLVNYRESRRQDPMELVTIEFYNRLLPTEPDLTAWERFLLFLKDNWQNLGLMSLVFCGLAVLWLISKPQKPEPIVIYEGLETPLEALDARLEEKWRREDEARRLAEEAEAEARREEFENSLGELGSLRSLRDEIAELIRNNPEAAAAIIKQWIGTSVLVEAKN